MVDEKTFKINDYLAVKLEGRETVIYVAGEPFIQCKKLLLNIPVENLENFSEIESIDEVADMLKWDIENGQDGVEYDLSPETEFIGHCSNLQSWYEHEYNINLLHTNIAFPLLKKLTEVGDFLAKRVFKEEIAKRFTMGSPNTIFYLIEEDYLNYLNMEERLSILNDLKLNRVFKEEIANRFRSGQPTVLKFLFNKGYLDYLKDEELLAILSLILEEDVKFRKNYKILFKILKGLSSSGNPKANKVFKEELVKQFSIGYPDTILFLIEENYLYYLKSMNEGRTLLEENFFTLLNTLDRIDDIDDKFKILAEILVGIQGTKLIDKYYSLIETKVISILNSLKLYLIKSSTYYPFIRVFDRLKDTPLINKQYSLILAKCVILIRGLVDIDEQFYGQATRLEVFKLLVKTFRETIVMNDLLPYFLNSIEQFRDKTHALSHLINCIKGIELSKENFTLIREGSFPDFSDKINANINKPYYCSECQRLHTKGRIYYEHKKFTKKKIVYLEDIEELFPDPKSPDFKQALIDLSEHEESQEFLIQTLVHYVDKAETTVIDIFKEILLTHKKDVLYDPFTELEGIIEFADLYGLIFRVDIDFFVEFLKGENVFELFWQVKEFESLKEIFQNKYKQEISDWGIEGSKWIQFLDRHDSGDSYKMIFAKKLLSKIFKQTIKCIECGTELEYGAEICFNCGNLLE